MGGDISLFPFVLILMPQLGLFALHLQKEKVTGVGTNSKLHVCFYSGKPWLTSG